MPHPASAFPVDAGPPGWLPEDLRSLEPSMAFLGALFEGNPDMVLLVGANGRIAGANARALGEFGFHRQNLEGQPIELLLPQAVRERHGGHLQKYFEHPTTRAMGSSMNLNARDRRGNEFPVDVLLHPFTAGGEQYVMAICHRLDAPLARSRTQIHALVDSAPEIAVNLLDAEGRILTWNEGARRIYNLTASRALGRDFSVLFTPQEIAAGEPQRQMELASRSMDGVRTAGWRKGAAGQSLWVEGQFRATRDMAGNVSGFTKVFRDLTPQKLVEEALHQSNQALVESERIFRLLVESVTDYAIYKLDPQGRVLTWNGGAERNQGYRQQEVLGQDFSIFFPPEAVEAGAPAQQLAAAARDGRYETQDWRLRKDGSEYWALESVSAIRSKDGELLGFSKVTRDMTAQKALEETQAQLTFDLDRRVTERTQQLEESVEQLKAKNGEVEALVALVSHDLAEKEVLLREVYHRVKNNLQMVQSLLKMGSRELQPSDARHAIDSAVQRVHVMAMVHEHLYQMPNLSRLSLPKYLREVVEGAIASSTERPERVRLHMEIEEIPVPLDLAIPLGLLANELVSNCLKHGIPQERSGKVTVSAHILEEKVRLVVQDDGVGLPDDFDAAKSTSMGLKLAASLAHQLGGRLEFSSSNGCRVQADLAGILPRRENVEPAAPFMPIDPATLIGAMKECPVKARPRQFADPSRYVS